jgi:tetratricopeptide (TPR) repeat protein
LVAQCPRERVPLQWAMTQHNLGIALSKLGEREAGTARLEEAVAAYRAALQEYTRERVPLDWASTQNNLGNALSRLGEREAGTARPEEARTCISKAWGLYKDAGIGQYDEFFRQLLEEVKQLVDARQNDS